MFLSDLRQIKVRSVITVFSATALVVSGLVSQPSPAKAGFQSNTIPSSTVSPTNEFDYYANFTGSQRLLSEVNREVIPTTPSFTVEAWVRPTALPATGKRFVVLSQGQAISAQDTAMASLNLVEASGKLQIVYSGGTGNVTTGVASGVPLNAWSHIAVTVDATAGTSIFLDGYKVAINATMKVAPVTTTPFSIGATGGATADDSFRGGIDQVKIWNGVLADADIKKSMHTWAAEGITTTTLRAHYDLNDKSVANGRVFDLVSTTGYHLAMTGEIQFSDVKEFGEFNGKQVFTFPRTYLTKHGGWIAPTGATSAAVLLVGAGGAGGRGGSDLGGGGGGGGGGQVKVVTASFTDSAALAIQVGQGGLGTTAQLTSATNGGDTSFSTLAQALGGGAGGNADASFGTAGAAAVYSGTESGGAGGLGGQNANVPGGGGSPTNNDLRPGGGGGGAGGAGGTGGVRHKGGPGLIVGVSTALASFQFAPVLEYGAGGGGGNFDADDLKNPGGVSAGNGGNEGADLGAGQPGKPNRGGGGGGGADGGKSGGSGGSGLIVVAIDFEAKCAYVAAGAVSKPSIYFSPLVNQGINSQPLHREPLTSTTPATFYGEPVIVNGKIYIPDRGNGQLKSVPIDAGSPRSNLGALPSPGLGAAADERYVFAWNSTGVARYDTLTGEFVQTWIPKGSLQKVDGEILFVRYQGKGYLFLTNGKEGTKSVTAGDIYAVQISNENGLLANPGTPFLFSKSMLAKSQVNQLPASGLAVIGTNIYWSSFSPTPADSTGALWSKSLSDLDTADNKVSDTNADALLISKTYGMQSLASDSRYLYYKVETPTSVLFPVNEARVFDPAAPVTSQNPLRISSGNPNLGANGIKPIANCGLPPSSVSASIRSDGKVLATLTMPWSFSGISFIYQFEYRINGGPWVASTVPNQGQGALLDIGQNVNGYVEVRAATQSAIGLISSQPLLYQRQMSEYTYALPFLVGTLPSPPLCANPTKLTYQVAANDQVLLPLTSYNGEPVSIDWGNGTQPVTTTWAANTRINLSQTYASAGTYNVNICGKFKALGAAGVFHPKLTALTAWGEAESTLTSLSFAFNGATILTDVPANLPPGVTSLESTFSQASRINDPDISTWNTSNVTNFRSTFGNAQSFNQNLGAWDTSKATTMELMFFNAGSFNNGSTRTIGASTYTQDSIKNWNTSSVTDLSSTFLGARSFNQPIGSWDVSKVSSFTSTFEAASAFNQPLGDWNTSSATLMRGMFAYASKFDQNLGNWDTGKVTNFGSMFSGAYAFNNGGSDTIKNWDTSAATNMANMFFNTARFNQPVATRTFSSGTVAAATTTEGVAGTPGTPEVATLTFSGSFAAGDILRFNNAANNQVVVVLSQPGDGVATATAVKSALELAPGIKYDIAVKDAVLTLTAKQSGVLANLSRIDQPSAWDVSNVTAMQYMFGKTDTFNQAVSSWDVSNVTNMDSMFWSASAFNNGSSGAGTWTWTTTKKVTIMQQMFASASAFKQVPKFSIDALTNARDMFNFSGLTDAQYGETLEYFWGEYNATPKRAKANVILGAIDKTAFCPTPHAAFLNLVKAPASSGAGWIITDKTNPGLSCAVKVTVTANSGSHVYGDPVPSIGFTVDKNLSNSDWIREIVCRAELIAAPNTAVSATSAAAPIGTYQTKCSGPTGSGIGLEITYVTGTYKIAKRPITVRAKNKVALKGKAFLVYSTSSGTTTETDDYMITSGTIANGDSLEFTINDTKPGGETTTYLATGTRAITIEAKSATATATNYEVTGVPGILTVSEKKYVLTAKSLTKVYGDSISFNTATGWICDTNEGVSCETELSGKVTLESEGASRSKAVGNYSITTGVTTASADYEIVNTNGGVLTVVKRKLTVTPNALTVNAGSAVPTYTFTITGFAEGEGVGNLPADYAPTCTSGYTQSTPRGSVLAITCSGGNAGSNYEFVFGSANLTVPGLSRVGSDVPQDIMLAENEIGTDVEFGFDIAPVQEVCYANLLIFRGEAEPQLQRKLVKPGEAFSFEQSLDIGEYEYELVLDGNCAIPATRGSFTISEYVVPPTPQAEPEVPAAPVVPVPYSGPIINDFSTRQLPLKEKTPVVLDGDRLDLITELWIGDVKIPFTRDSGGKIKITAPELPAGVYDLLVSYEGGGTLIHQAAFTVVGLSTDNESAQGGPVSVIGTKTLRYTNFAGDRFSLPQSARVGITRVITSLDNVNRVVCRGITSARSTSAADQKLAENRAKQACNLARQLAPTASIELRTSPAAGVGPRFRAVNLFIVYSLD